MSAKTISQGKIHSLFQVVKLTFWTPWHAPYLQDFSGAVAEDFADEEEISFEAFAAQDAVVVNTGDGPGAEYEVEAAAIPSDGQPHRVAIARLELVASEVSHVAVPRAAARAFLRVGTRNDSPFVLLPGVARCHVGGRYVASTAMELISPGQDFTLPFGADEHVVIKADPDKHVTENKGVLWDKQTASRHRHAFSVANNGQADIKIAVEDVIPDSSHEEIKVKVVDYTSRSVESCAGCALAFEKGSGGKAQEVAWSLTLPAGTKQPLELTYEVSWPKGKSVTGNDRYQGY